MTSFTYPNSKLMFTHENGNTGTTILPESITTPSISLSSITDSTGSTGSSGYVLSSTGDGIAWITPPSGSNVTTDLDMNNNDINVNTVTTTDLSANTITSATTFTNQVTFNTQPTCSVLPTESNHLATKEYADTFTTSTANYPYNLYLNLSQPRTIVGSTSYSGFVGTTGITGYTLSNTLTTPIGSTGPQIDFTVPLTNTNYLLATFISDPINITSIPDSLWQLKLYSGSIVTTGTFSYTFTLELYRENNTYITLTNISSSTGEDMNSAIPNTNPYMYTINLKLLDNITLPTDRIVLQIYYKCTSSIATLNSVYFENNYYSHLNILLNDISCGNLDNITNLITNTISSDNDISINVPNGTLTIGSTASTINISGSTGNIYLFSEKKNGLININKPFVPLYTILPSAGQIGEFISIPAPTSQLFPVGLTDQISSTVQIASYTLPYKGTYFTSATVDVNCTTAIGTLNTITLEILTASVMTGRQDIIASLPSQIGTNNILHCSCIIYDNNLSTVTLQLTLTYTGNGAQYQTPNSNFFVWNFVRLS